MSTAFEWAGRSGESWAERWQQTDRALEPVGAALLAAALQDAPPGPFAAFDIGCGAGATSLALAASRPDSAVLGCDLSAALIAVAKRRAAHLASVRFAVGDAAETAAANGPFDLLLSRHGVMFFTDPPAAFAALRAAARGGASMVFSCFRSWEENPWASELASAAAGRQLPAPGREPSGFAFAEPDYVRELLEAAGWAAADPSPFSFDYVASDGRNAVEGAMDFLGEIGPASSVIRAMPAKERPAAVERMRKAIERHFDGEAVRFPAAAWIWRARAAGAGA